MKRTNDIITHYETQFQLMFDRMLREVGVPSRYTTAGCSLILLPFSALTQTHEDKLSSEAKVMLYKYLCKWPDPFTVFLVVAATLIAYLIWLIVSELTGFNRMKVTLEMLEIETLMIRQHHQENAIIFLKTSEARQKVPTFLREICWIQAKRNETAICVLENGRQQIRYSSLSLKDWEALLPAQRFCRIRRSRIINMRHVEVIEGESVRMKDNEWIRIGGVYKDRFFKDLNGVPVLTT